MAYDEVIHLKKTSVSTDLTNYYTKPETDDLLDSKIGKDWRHYIGKVFYNGIETTIAGGQVLECIYEATTIYRYITTANDSNGYPIEDAFYGAFDGTNLTSLIATRG